MSTYETHVMKNPKCPFIFHKNMLCKTTSPSRFCNWHENVEIIYIVRGHGIITVDTQPLKVNEADSVVINANSLHQFEARGESLCYHCLIVDRAFCRDNYFDTNQIRFDGHFKDAELENLFHTLEEEYPQQATDSPYRILTVRATVLQIMARLCRYHSLPDAPPTEDVFLLSCIKQAIGYIRSGIDRSLSLDEVSAFVGLSKFYFAREFKRITGYTFVSYVNMIRYEKAKALLSEGRLGIGEISRTCGFDNQSYFSRTFREYTGVLPSAYRKNETK